MKTERKFILGIFNEKTVYYCSECGSTIKLEDKLCNNCGLENVIRIVALEKLEEIEKSIENEKEKGMHYYLAKQFPQWKEVMLLGKSYLIDPRKLRLRKVKLIIGNNLEDKIRWVKTQFHDMNRRIQDIADDLEESMITVRKYIDSETQGNDIK